MENGKRNSFFRRWIRDPLVNQLTQGVSAEKLAQSLAWACVLGIFPILGTTSVLCAIVGVRLRLNHVAMQSVNWLMYPIQIGLIIPFLKLGNYIFLGEGMTLSLVQITKLFADDFTAASINLGGLALRGMAAWLILAPFMITILRKIFIIPLRPLSAKLHVRRSEP